MIFTFPVARPLLLASLLFAGLCGCHAASVLSSAPGESPQAEQAAILNTQREEINQIPPPAKSRYLAVRSLETWENPYLTIQPGMVTLHVLRGDSNPDPSGAGGLLRPVGARREDLNLSFAKLADALSSIPADAWPYGRVVAVEEAHKTPPAGEPQVRRNMEVAMKTLNDLGIVVYEWNGPPKS
jgi:hypothetical protein